MMRLKKEMNVNTRKTVLLEVQFGSRKLYDRFIRTVTGDPALESNVVRGRIAEDKVWLQLELRGAARRVDEVIKRWREASTGIPQAVA